MIAARPLALAALLSLSATGLAAEPRFSADAFKAHVAFLSDDLLEGRGTGTRGHEIAARYVASQFMALGLKPAGDNGGWYQQVPFQERRLVKGAVTISGPAGSTRYENGTEIVVAPSALEVEQDISAGAVFVGYGIDAPSQGFDDYRGLDVKGKIVVAIEGFPEGFNSEIGAHLASQKRRAAMSHGAIGFVDIATPRHDQAQPWSSVLRNIGLPGVSWLETDGKPHVEAPGIRAAASLNGPAARLVFAGAPRTFDKVTAEADAGGRPAGFPLKTTIRVERTTTYRSITSPEVAGMLPGSDPTLKDQVIVLMGHLDHLGMKASGEGDRIYNGALDNAAGVATMLEVARAFAEGPDKPRRSILFIANTAEEKGLLGADYFAHHPTVPITSIVGLVDLDMPVLLYPFTDVVAFGADHSTMGPTVAKAAAAMGVKLAPDPFPEQGVFTRSDHYMFVKQGVPAIFFATGYANGGHAAWDDFFAHHYHQVSDDMSQPILWDQGARFARINYLVTKLLADDDRRPLWYKGDFFGDAFAPKAEKVAKGK